MYKRKVEYLDIKTMNNHLAYVRDYRKIIYDAPEIGNIGLNAYIEDRQTWFSLTYKYKDSACTYKLRKDGADVQQFTDGTEAFKILNQYYKVPRVENVDKIGSAKPFIYKNSIYEDKRVNAIGYDLNSAYSFAMLKPMPNTSVPPRCGYIKKGEIGFYDGEYGLEAITEGFSLWVFPLMESPFKKFVEHWYNLKKKGNPKAKGILNYSIGYLQRVNPFIRATIITYCNNTIKELLKKYPDIIYCNTDAIVTLTEKPELKLGDGIGEWKIEKKGTFAFSGYNYQWNKELPHIRGIPRRWFNQGWDILNDPLPNTGNEYEYDKEKVKLVKVK